MSILFLFNGTFPAGMAMSKRLHLYGKALLSQGIAPCIKFPSSEPKLTEGIKDGISYASFKNPVIFKNYILRQLNRIYAAFFYAKFCYNISREYKIIFISGFGWFTEMMMIMGSHAGKAKIIVEVNENPYSPEGGRLDFEFVRKIRRRLELHLPVGLADGFIVISEGLKEMVQKYKNRDAHIVKIPILVDTPTRETCGIKSRDMPYILHAGAVSETKDGIIAVFEAFTKACKQTSLKLNFVLTIKVLHPKLLSRIEEIISRTSLGGRVVFKGLLSEEDLDDLRVSSTLAIVNKPSNWQNDYNFPTKLGELLSFGIPVIASKTGEMSKYLTDNITAFIVPENDSDEMAQKILLILNHPKIAYEVGQRGKQLALEEFHYERHAKVLADFFINL